MTDITWLFFDLGSTLIDESESWELRYRETTGNTPVSYQAFKDKVLSFAAVSDRPYREALRFFGLSKTKWHTEAEKPYPFAEPLLAELSKKYRLGVIANQPGGSERRLAAWRLGQYFDLVIASAEAGVEKPNPEIFEIALQQADCEPNRAVMVGDRLDNDILPAKRLGMKTVWVKQGFARLQPDSALPDVTIHTLEEINTVL